MDLTLNPQPPGFALVQRALHFAAMHCSKLSLSVLRGTGCSLVREDVEECSAMVNLSAECEELPEGFIAQLTGG